MKIKNITTKIVLGITLFLLSSVSVLADFGVSPSDIYNEYLRPGSSFDTEFTLSRSESLEELDISIETDLGDIEKWFSFNPGSTFKFEQGQKTKTFTVTVNIPEDAEYTEYNGIIRVNAMPSYRDVKGVSIRQGVRLNAGLIVTEATVKKLSILAIKTSDSIVGEPVEIEIVGENQGNVDISPRVVAKIMNLNKELLEEHEITDFGSIDANQTTTLTAELLTGLPVGEYFIEVAVFLNGEELREELMVFYIKESIEEELKEQKAPIFSGMIEFFRRNKTYLVIILSSMLLGILVYILLGKLWEKKSLSKHKKKPWAVILGSKKYTRATLSFAVGFITLLGILLFPALTVKRIEVEDTEFITGETQGVQDTDLSLTVFPSIEVPRYVIYSEPSKNSEIIYKAAEDEKFDVIQEIQDWYKVSLQDGNSGWLHKTMIKSHESEEK